MWRVRAPLPATLLSDGARSVPLSTTDGTTLAACHLATGAPLADEIGAEVALLRAEIDPLERAFRRHVRDSAD